MNEPRIREKAEKDRNWLEQKLRSVPGFSGYLEKEERRETDKKLREHLANRLGQTRSRLDPVMRELTDRGGMETFDLVEKLDRVKKALEKLTDRIQYASYGYSGLFDVVKIREPELDRLYRFDVALLERVEEMQNAVESLEDADLSPEEMRERVKEVLQLSREFDEHLDARRELLMSESSQE